MAKYTPKLLSNVSKGERDTLAQCIYHRFIKFESGLNLIKRDQPNRIGVYKSVEAGQGSDTCVPVNYLNSIEHINNPLFVPDMNHNLTLEKILVGTWGDEYRYQYDKCDIFMEEGYRVMSDGGSVSPIMESKEKALIWSICMICPF